MSEELVTRLAAAASLLEYLETPLTAADIREGIAALTAQQEPVAWKSIDDSQSWDKLTGAQAHHLIGRHADSWTEIDRMMTAWNLANQRPTPPSGIREGMLREKLMRLYKNWRQGENRPIDSHWAAMSILSALQPPSAAADQVEQTQVPVEPTEAMRDAGNEIILDRSKLYRAWKAMLRAAQEGKK